MKRATVALGVAHGSTEPGREPFTICGTGFCIDPSGIIVTCRHVQEAFFSKSIAEMVAALPQFEGSLDIEQLDVGDFVHPEVLFYDTETSEEELWVYPVSVEAALTKQDWDLGLFRLRPHKAYPEGFPSLPIAEYEAVFEGAAVATCGFPLGTYLHEQIGTKTSSFTRGSLSTVAPAQGVPKDLVKGYQLDLTATYGNSGGPVFLMSSGGVFGVLKGGVPDENGDLMRGVVRAEPVYPVVNPDTLENLRAIGPDIAGAGKGGNP